MADLNVGPSRGSVLFINRVFPPNPGATGQLLSELTTDLDALGITVKVLAARHQGGDESAPPTGRVQVDRSPCLPSTRRSLLLRAASVASIYPMMLWRLLRSKGDTAWVSMSDPQLIVAIASLIGHRRGVRLIHWSQDIYPDVAEQVGVIPKGGWIARLLGDISSWALRQQDLVICLGRCMRDRLLQKGVAPERIVVIPNWVDPGKVWPVPRQPNSFRNTHQLGDRPLVMYSGNLGRAHALMPLLDSAQALATSLSEARLLFVGEGPQKAALQAECERRNLRNVLFMPSQPIEHLADTLGAADLHLITMNEALCGLVVPSKLYGVLGAARPALFLGPVESEVAWVLSHYECGETVPAGDPQLLADHICTWLTDPEGCRVAGAQAAQAAQVYSRSQAVRAFADALAGPEE